MKTGLTWWLFERFGMRGMRTVDMAAVERLSPPDQARVRVCIETAAELVGVQAEQIGAVILLRRA